ncbi:hypothetical protein [Paenibacillus hamazuiensis]|uniref:hypothetical protein n=1 Tax=Paenibacillus hamazuiensis TaxID=2936508 RepID=UPI00200C613B|nr:hypothetical protein [Paenibacillus hamazuiensis]
MLTNLLVQIALILVIIRSGYKAFLLLSSRSKMWLEILYYFAVALLALKFFL